MVPLSLVGVFSAGVLSVTYLLQTRPEINLTIFAVSCFLDVLLTSIASWQTNRSTASAGSGAKAVSNDTSLSAALNIVTATWTMVFAMILLILIIYPSPFEASLKPG